MKTRLDFVAIVPRIAAGDRAAAGELYGFLNSHSRPLLAYLSPLHTHSIDDHVHELFVSLVESIRARRLRDPERLPSYADVITRRLAAQSYRAPVHVPLDGRDFPAPAPPPEAIYSSGERARLCAEALASLGSRDRAVVSRFYLAGEAKQSISGDLGLSETQFRLVKSRALGQMRGFVNRRLKYPAAGQKNRGRRTSRASPFQ